MKFWTECYPKREPSLPSSNTAAIMQSSSIRRARRRHSTLIQRKWQLRLGTKVSVATTAASVTQPFTASTLFRALPYMTST